MNTEAIDPDGQQSPADERALSALGGRDRIEAAAADLRPVEFVRSKYGLDPARYDDDQALADDVQAAARDGDVNRLDADAQAGQRVHGSDDTQDTSDVALAALNGQERVQAAAKGIDAATFIRAAYDLDPRRFSQPGDLRAAMDDRADDHGGV